MGTILTTLITNEEKTMSDALAKKNRAQEMLNRAHCERALTYEKMGKKAQARKDLELVLVNEPGNEEVKRLLGELA